MVLPLSVQGMDPASEELPQVVKDVYATYWWALVILMGTLTLIRCIAGDVIGGVNTMLLGVITWCMVRDNCARMTQVCVFCYTAMCAAQTIIETISLIGMMGGRTFGSTTSITTGGDQTTYTTTVEKHPFFDPTMGAFYNFQSVVLCLTPIVALLGLLLGYMTYQAFPGSLFEPPAGNAAPYQGYGTTLGGGGGGPVGGGGRMGDSFGQRLSAGGRGGQSM